MCKFQVCINNVHVVSTHLNLLLQQLVVTLRLSNTLPQAEGRPHIHLWMGQIQLLGLYRIAFIHDCVCYA